MRRTIPAILFVSIFALSCSERPTPITLEKDTSTYRVGKQIAETHPYMDPDSNLILAGSRRFQISAGEVLSWMESTMGNRFASLASIDSAQLRLLVHQTLTRLGEKKLLLDAAIRSRVQISDADVDSVYRLQFRQFGSEVAFKQRLEAEGIEPDFVREDIRDNMIISRHLESEINRRGKVTDSEIAEAYEAYRADTVVTVRHILLLTQDKNENEKRAIRNRMEGLLKRARAGEDFSELARAYTEDPGSKDNGGLYENFPRGVMVKPFENAAFSVPVGEISDIVETRYGYHILKIVDRKQKDEPLEDIRSMLEENLIGQKRDRIIRDYIKSLEVKNRFEIYPFG